MPVAWLAVLALRLAAAHPMHTAVAELTADAAGRTEVTLRLFADDLAAGVPDGFAAGDSAMSRYVRGTFALSDRADRPVRLVWRRAERSGDVVLLHLAGDVPGGLAGARITSLVLCDRFEDQVNVVRATYAGRTETLLFTRGEASKTLP